MRKICTTILICILAFSFTACNGAVFKGSRIGNEDQLIMDYEVLNTTDSQKLKLKMGDVVNFEVVSQSGSVNILLQNDREEPLYEGRNIPTSTFQVEIEESGDYTVLVTGKNAKGSVSIIKSGSAESGQ